MDMTPAYLTQAAAAMAKVGFAHAELQRDLGLADGLPCRGTQHRLTRDQTQLVLEHVAHPSAGDMYYLEVVEHAGIRLPSFRLDAWKVWPDRIEFKFYETEDGRSGLSLTFTLSRD
jgi:hypothetical protein